MSWSRVRTCRATVEGLPEWAWTETEGREPRQYCLSAPTFVRTTELPGSEAVDPQFPRNPGASNQPSASTSEFSHAQSETIVPGCVPAQGGKMKVADRQYHTDRLLPPFRHRKLFEAQGAYLHSRMVGEKRRYLFADARNEAMTKSTTLLPTYRRASNITNLP